MPASSLVPSASWIPHRRVLRHNPQLQPSTSSGNRRMTERRPYWWHTAGVSRSPVATGVALAAAAAVMFGVTTPIIAYAGRDIGPLLTAALLYIGAALT